MAQSKNQQLRCEACGKQFDSRETLQQHARECTGMTQSSTAGQKTRTAGSHENKS